MRKVSPLPVLIAEMPNKLKKVYELEGLVSDLHAHFTAESGSSMVISKSKATELISSTIFDYEPNTRYVLIGSDFGVGGVYLLMYLLTVGGMFLCTFTPSGGGIGVGGGVPLAGKSF